MNTSLIRQIRQAIATIQPEQIRQAADRPLAILLVASSSQAYAEMEDFLMPPELSRARRLQLANVVYRAGDPDAPEEFSLEIYEKGLPHGGRGFTFDRDNPQKTVQEIIERREDLMLALARHFPPFRKAATERIIRNTARDAALFSVVTALPNVLPGLFSITWALGEFASDTAVITAMQVRMAFLLAAASDHPVGFFEQKGEIISIIAGAFGWRALARELAGKVPLGGGLVPKAAVAYAGTYVVGKGLEKYYSLGYGLSRQEREKLYEEAYERGRQLVRSFLNQQSSETVSQKQAS